MSPEKYTLHMSICAVAIIASVLALNYAVDPYAITGAGRVPGFNQYKVDINNFTRLSKKYQPLKHRYSVLIVGNSRVEIGINPAHRCFNKAGWSVYNLGIPGASVRSQLEYALNVMYQQPIEKVLLSLDFTDFLSSNPQAAIKTHAVSTVTSGELGYLPSGVPNPDFKKIMFLDYYKSLLSLDGLISSVKTVAMQSDSSTDRDESGFNPARDFMSAVRVEGPRVLFDQKLHELNGKYSGNWYLRDSTGRLSDSFDAVAEFLAIAATRKVEVLVFTNPFHNLYWDLMRRKNLMTLYADWNESIATLVRMPSSGSPALWDFSQDSPYIHENVPAAGAKTGPLNWFWEPAHYRKELGDLMVDAMLADSCNTEPAFGRRLN